MTKKQNEGQIILGGQKRELDRLSENCDGAERSQHDQAQDLDDLTERASRLLKRAGAQDVNQPVTKVVRDEKQRDPVADGPAPTWEEMVARYSDDDLLVSSLDDLLPSSVVKQLEKELEKPVQREKWKRSDYIAVAAAGMAGALFDLLQNHKLLLRPDLHEKIPHRKHAIDFALGGNTHRVISGGHDLLRFAEARQMLIEGKYQALFRGEHSFATFYRYGGKEFPYEKIGENAATIALLTHWLADFFSKRSLPVPGWSYLTQKDGRLADFAYKSYKAGLNVRSVLSNLSGVALTGFILRLYTYIQQYSTTQRADFFLWKNLKYQEMCLVAQSINLLVNAAKVAVTQNFYAINAPAVLACVRHMIPVIRECRQRSSPLAISKRNRELLNHGWEEFDAHVRNGARESSEMKKLLAGPELVV